MGHVRNSGGMLYQLPSSTGNLWLLHLNLVRAIRFDLGSISRLWQFEVHVNYFADILSVHASISTIPHSHMHSCTDTDTTEIRL